MAGSSFLCPACGGLVDESRRRAHESHWCPASAQSSSDEETELKRSEEVKELLSPIYCREVAVALALNPRHPFSFQQVSPDIDIKESDHDTGGQVWRSEMVLADYLLHLGTAGHEPRGPVVALGCGSGPLSGYAAASLGLDVLLTDLPETLPLAATNTRHNDAAIDALATAVGDALGRAPQRGRLDFTALPFGAVPPPVREWLGPTTPGLVLCSDCLWGPQRHRALAATLAELLATGQALIAYQRRGREAPFFESCLAHYGLTSERLDISRVLDASLAPLQSAHHRSFNPSDCFFVHRVWKATA